MKLFNSVGPNPKVVRMYMAERGIEANIEEVDLMGGVNRQSDYLKLNPAGTTPALELDNGDVISEITCICEYLDDLDKSGWKIIHQEEVRKQIGMAVPVLAAKKILKSVK